MMMSELGQSTRWIQTNPNCCLLVWEYRTIHQQRIWSIFLQAIWLIGNGKSPKISAVVLINVQTLDGENISILVGALWLARCSLDVSVWRSSFGHI